jgi:hypothetical protein
MSPHSTVTRRPETSGTHPGPSRTITVEPIRIPASPPAPRIEPQHEPEPRKPDPEREPVPT